MNVLFVVPYIPSLIRVRSFNFIRGIAAQGHRVTLVALYASERELDDVEAVKPYCQDIHTFHVLRLRSLLNCAVALPSKTPLQYVYSWTPETARQIVALINSRHESNRFDIVHIEHLRGARFGIFLKEYAAKNGQPLPLVWDSVDSISFLFRQTAIQSKRLISRMVSRFELNRTEKYESWLIDEFDRVLVTSQADKKALLSLNRTNSHTRSVHVIQNGVDLKYFSPNDSQPREQNSLIVSGKMSYHANITMVHNLVHDIMPRIWAQNGDVRLYIVGKDPPGEISTLSNNPLITVTGTVPDIRPYLQRVAVAVTPLLYGAGIQNKVLEAMASSTPVVSSPQAISSLQLTPGENVIVANNPDDFADAVLRLLGDEPKRKELGQAGRAYVEKFHKWSTMASELEAIYMDAIYMVPS